MSMMRYLGVDYGRKRLGLALSDASGQLATPWRTVEAGGTPASACAAVMQAMAERDRDTLGEDPIDALVVGVPVRLNGDATRDTADARDFAARVAAASGCPVHVQDERLTSHEADERLREREPDWRARKRKLDAAAAAIILQDYLDGRSSRS